MDYLAADIPVGAGQLAGQAIPIKVRAVEKSQKIRPTSGKQASPYLIKFTFC
uniref:hypothetical protein n=1 Tax=Algoriphagus sp. TaxID=1872435 RepID=UPI0040477E88